MGDLTKNFSRHEFRCHCGCGGDTVDYKTLIVLQKIRQHFGQPIRIESGYRCKKWNKAIGGRKNSQHLTGRAVDFKVFSVEPTVIQAHFNTLYPSQFGMGSYSTFTHIDTRSSFARWQG